MDGAGWPVSNPTGWLTLTAEKMSLCHRYQLEKPELLFTSKVMVSSGSSELLPKTAVPNIGQQTVLIWMNLSVFNSLNFHGKLKKYHRGIKQFCGIERSQVRSAKAQNHIGLAIRTFLRFAVYCFKTGHLAGFTQNIELSGMLSGITCNIQIMFILNRVTHKGIKKWLASIQPFSCPSNDFDSYCLNPDPVSDYSEIKRIVIDLYSF